MGNCLIAVWGQCSDWEASVDPVVCHQESRRSVQ